MSFEIEVGHASRRGPREINEDFAGARFSAPGDAVRGVVAAIADGVSSGGRGLEAAQTSVMSLIGDFFDTPATWETSVALDRLISAQNSWLVAQNRQRADGASALTTLSALVLQGQGYTIAHVGDSRVWRMSGGEATLLTHDHAYAHPDMRSRLTRAVGLDEMLLVDYVQGEVQVGDVFVLTSDGVHGALKARRIAELAAGDSAQAASEAIVEAAVAAGSTDNATALVIRVLGLDAARLEDETALFQRLPPLELLRPGEVVDGYTVTALVADTGVHRLYQAREPGGAGLVVLKTLSAARSGDPEERAMLAHEAWLATRVTERDARGFVRSRPVQGASRLYAVFDWHAGKTLEQLLDQGTTFGVAEVTAAAAEIVRAIGRLHRQGVIHRDIKPGNLHRGDDGQWRLLDLGVAISGREGAAARELHAGTPSYVNPEQWSGAPCDAGSDLFAFGVTLYRWLTGRLPYGEIEPYQAARYRRDPLPPSRLRPDVPIWLDHLVLKAVALDPRRRFETAEELLLALQRGASRPLGAPGATPLVARDPAVVWKIALGVSVAFNLLLMYWLLFLPR
jgi:serine/threonine protein phosphatase PrpC